MHPSKWPRLSTYYTLKTKWFNLRRDEIQLPDGTHCEYHVVEHPGFVVVVAITDDNKVIMEQVYRYPVNHHLLECPSGGLDDDTPQACAVRELEEETGYIAYDYKHLGHFHVSPGRGDERFDLFFARNAQPVGKQQLEATEDIKVKLIDFDALFLMAKRGEISDSSSALAILIAYPYYKSVS